MSNLISQVDWTGLINLALRVTAVLLCIMVHEVSHGLAAYMLGDPTAKSRHRLSFNPLRHIDPFGALMMVVVGFGWAKPVPIDPRYFKNPKRGMAITALAGPVSNFVLAYLSLVLCYAILPFYAGSGGETALSTLLGFLYSMARLSIGLGIFNLFPFPPLDGSKVLGALLPTDLYYEFLRFERYGMLILMAVLWLGILDVPLNGGLNAMLQLLDSGARWPYDLIVTLF